MICDPYQLLVIGANLLFREGSIGKTPLYVNEERAIKRGVRCRLLSSVNCVYFRLKGYMNREHKKNNITVNYHEFTCGQKLVLFVNMA